MFTRGLFIEAKIVSGGWRLVVPLFVEINTVGMYVNIMLGILIHCFASRIAEKSVT